MCDVYAIEVRICVLVDWILNNLEIEFWRESWLGTVTRDLLLSSLLKT